MIRHNNSQARPNPGYLPHRRPTPGGQWTLCSICHANRRDTIEIPGCVVLSDRTRDFGTIGRPGRSNGDVDEFFRWPARCNHTFTVAVCISNVQVEYIRMAVDESDAATVGREANWAMWPHRKTPRGSTEHRYHRKRRFAK